ncbi:ATP synthase F1 subunit epsilon [Stella sp.]|uniref:ATP synthase F1 subunit epsilon n=1 Tax=Stella sp. TaxID=2912054 RepID=UPI0035B13766
MAATIEFELVSPERLLLAKPVEMVVVPGSEGDFGVMAQHAPMIAAVRPGVIAIFQGGKVAERIFVAGGVAEVTAERCTVLAERAVPVGDIDRAAVERKLADDREDAATAEVAIGEAMLAALDRPAYH